MKHDLGSLKIKGTEEDAWIKKALAGHIFRTPRDKMDDKIEKLVSLID